MKRHMHKTYLGLAAVATAALAGLASGGGASALTYSTSYTMNFTVDESVTVSVPSEGLIISELMPGTSADSETITVNVQSNSENGYTLNATVGNATYNTRNLIHENAPTNTSVFNSVDFGTSLTALETDNTWGYSFSTDGSTWANYSGLPLYSDEDNVATIASTSAATAAAGDDIIFKIAAKAAAAQALGEYNNIINFTAVANAARVLLYMQDVASWESTVSTGDVVEAIDTRDNKTYYVSRLADGNLWMTQNLDLDLDSGTTYTSSDTDISANWTPSAATNTSWNWSDTEPDSYDPGELCWNGVIDTSYSGTLDTHASSDCRNRHYHIGNYYNWTAAVAMNDSSAYETDGEDVDQSICPAGWRLPTYSGEKSFDNLNTAAGFSSGTSGNIHTAPAYFAYSGEWFGGSSNVGSSGYFWSSVTNDSDGAYILHSDADGDLRPRANGIRDNGFSVRCVAR